MEPSKEVMKPYDHTQLNRASFSRSSDTSLLLERARKLLRGNKESSPSPSCSINSPFCSETEATSSTSGRVFECNTGNKKIHTFQALGGHRASRKKLKLTADLTQPFNLARKAKTHECSICGLEFALGQALGGHMGRHRPAMRGIEKPEVDKILVPVLKRSSSSKRGFGLDLNFSPLENDLKLMKMAPMMD